MHSLGSFVACQPPTQHNCALNQVNCLQETRTDLIACAVSCYNMAIKFHCHPGLVSFFMSSLARINSGLQDTQPGCSILYLSNMNLSDIVTLEIVVALKPAQKVFKCTGLKVCNEVYR